MEKNKLQPASNQFKKVKTQSGKIALEAYSAVWRQSNGEDIAICAPSREMLTRAFPRVTGRLLDELGVQAVWITQRGNNSPEDEDGVKV